MKLGLSRRSSAAAPIALWKYRKSSLVQRHIWRRLADHGAQHVPCHHTTCNSAGKGRRSSGVVGISGITRPASSFLYGAVVDQKHHKMGLTTHSSGFGERHRHIRRHYSIEKTSKQNIGISDAAFLQNSRNLRRQRQLLTIPALLTQSRTPRIQFGIY